MVVPQGLSEIPLVEATSIGEYNRSNYHTFNPPATNTTIQAPGNPYHEFPSSAPSS